MRFVDSPSEISWLDTATVHAVHEAQVSEHGGAVGVRDSGLFDSALHRARRGANDADPPATVPALAAIYGIAFVRDQPFFDGNNRVGLVMLELFLRMNGYRLAADNAACVGEILALAAGERTDEQFIDWVSRHATR